MKKVYIETHGCQMNVHDSEKAVLALSNEGYELASDMAEADLVLLNTCMVREKPEQKVFKRIDSIKHEQRKEHGKKSILGVMGCVAQAEAERIFERSRDVSIVIGTQSIARLPQMVKQIEQGYSHAIDVTLTKDAEFFEISPATRQTKHVAYVSIIEGCNKFCSYCIVPFTRGRERSRSADKILAEIKGLAEQGYKEVQLLGQNVNSYGLSGRFRGNVSTNINISESNEITFAALLKLVAKEGGVPRIKYATSYPRDFDQELIHIMDGEDALCEWIHLPAQSGSNRVLKRMRRGYTVQEYMHKISFIKTAKKDYSVTGDIIVGFPGETEEDFLETMRLIAEVEYDGLYVFQYSARPNTAALAYEESVAAEVKTERLMRLVELQNRIQKRRYERYLGAIVEVLIEGSSTRSLDEYTGHTRCNKTVNFPKGKRCIGELVQVRIDKAGKNSLHGVII